MQKHPSGNEPRTFSHVAASLGRRFVTLGKIASTFALVCLGWVFFRAESMGQAFAILHRMAIDAMNGPAYAALIESALENKMTERSIWLLLAFVVFEWVQRGRECPLECLSRFWLPVRWAAYTALIWGALYLLPVTGSQKFIYFEF